jgi:hypothetical protein
MQRFKADFNASPVPLRVARVAVLVGAVAIVTSALHFETSRRRLEQAEVEAKLRANDAAQEQRRQAERSATMQARASAERSRVDVIARAAWMDVLTAIESIEDLRLRSFEFAGASSEVFIDIIGRDARSLEDSIEALQSQLPGWTVDVVSRSSTDESASANVKIRPTR